MIFRWSVWGDYISKNIELLRCSVLSFKKQFGSRHQYVIYTDNAGLVSKLVNISVEVRRFPSEKISRFCTAFKATWLKWCPSPRLDIAQDEFYVDSDVFLLKYPKEIDLFLSNPKMKFAVLDEFFGQPWQHGAMHKRASSYTPFINAGFFIQKAGYDISNDLVKEFEWWRKNVHFKEQTHHDEQGALATALTNYLMNDELLILPKKKYLQISKTSNPDIEKLDNVVLLHATYPDHPAFYKFKPVLDKILFE